MSMEALDDYVPVAERIEKFYELYPQGRLTRAEAPSTITLDGRSFIAYAAAAYRTPDDPHPAIGMAWEPVPGPTSFTKDSELMNAETSAWGRAIAALGIETSRGTASREEVTARRGPDGSQGGATDGATEAPAAVPHMPHIKRVDGARAANSLEQIIVSAAREVKRGNNSRGPWVLSELTCTDANGQRFDGKVKTFDLFPAGEPTWASMERDEHPKYGVSYMATRANEPEPRGADHDITPQDFGDQLVAAGMATDDDIPF